jgi:murein DD-endopeptidase MepM/ murein hydrolase activator NlpD
VPPRRPTSGRHRRKKNSHAPAYFTAATLAAFAVSGLNVPGAIGAAREGASRSTTREPVLARPRAENALAAAQLRNRIAGRSSARASRLRTAQQEAITAATVASRRAKAAAENSRPRWVLPISGYHLTAGFGMVSGLWSHSHTGQDFAAGVGTPIRAVGDGTIIFASYDGAYGNKIVIRHADGTVTWYCHMNDFVRTEGPVKAGELIGHVGSTGNTTGPHLHFEVRPHGDDGQPIEPMAWLRARGLKP